MTRERRFFSKILLFGEYGVICNSMGLTIPFTYFSGGWAHTDGRNPVHAASNESLRDFLHYLKELEHKNELLAALSLQDFEADICQGLYFESTIPQGFGVGSSGALCAAIYDSYARNPILLKSGHEEESLLQLKRIFAQMESFFHGVSSGLDPLNCYVRKPVLIKDKSSISLVDLPEHQWRNSQAVFLIDTGLPGKTGPLVKLFFDKCRQHSFYKKFSNECIPLNNRCIQSFVAGDMKAFYRDLRSLSAFFLDHFEPMIPERFHDLWQNGLDTSGYYLKLCGSGGGGFLLGFTPDFEKTRAEMTKRQLDIIAVF